MKEKAFNKLPDPENNKDFNVIKLTFKQIKDMFPNDSYASVAMTLKFLLEETYIHTDIVGSENTFNIDALDNGNHKLIIGEKVLHI